jgi:DNA polymerase-3 subunit epsilon
MFDFTAIDFETANYSRKSAISVGLVKFRSGEPAARFYSLIRPPVLYIRPDFTEIHGLTAADVRNERLFADVWAEMKKFIGGDILAAHNAAFDRSVLEAALKHYGIAHPGYQFICSAALAKKAWPGLSSYRLTELGKRFNIVYKAHNALEDAETCGKIVCLATARLKKSEYER